MLDQLNYLLGASTSISPKSPSSVLYIICLSFKCWLKWSQSSPDRWWLERKRQENKNQRSEHRSWWLPLEPRQRKLGHHCHPVSRKTFVSLWNMHLVAQPISENNNLSGFLLSRAQLYLTSIFTRSGSANLVVVYFFCFITVSVAAFHVIHDCNGSFKQIIWNNVITCKILRYL